jgi:glycosyltransferase involved in cell wall biosynthesis
MKKRLLYIRADIFDGELIAGGSVTHTVGIIQGYAKQGYEILCASSIMLGILQKLSLTALLPLNNPKIFKFLRWKVNCLLSNIFFTLQILKLLQKTGPINFIYQRYTLLNCSGILISRLKKIPCILEYNGSEVWMNKHWAQKKWFSFNRLISLIEIINLKKANFIVVVSEALKEELVIRGIAVEKILINPNGVDVDLYNPDLLKNERATIRKQLKIENKFVFGFIGTFSPWHGIEMLRDSMAKIIKKHPESHFLLIGDGPLLPMLKESVQVQNIQSHITFTGILSPENARHYLAACDAYVSPTQPNPDGTRFFGSPTKLFEYMSMAKPIIASDLEQLADIIQPAIRLTNLKQNYEQKLGLLISPTDHEEFIQAAYTLVNSDQETLHKIGNNARQKAVNEFSWIKHVEKIEKFIEMKK